MRTWAMVALLAGCSGETLIADGGTGDAGTPPVIDDASMASDDGGPGGFDATSADSGRAIDGSEPTDDDAGMDAGVDAGTDAGPDAETDSGVDTDVDAGVDDVDAGTDSGVDSGPPPDTTRPAHVAAGTSMSCAVRASGNVFCWGTVGTPVRITGVSNAVSVEVGDDHACAIDDFGDVWCWGAGSYGELGNGATTTISYSAVRVMNLVGPAVDLAIGADHSCALTDDSAGTWIQCWGRNHVGQLANPSLTGGFYTTAQLGDAGLTNLEIDAIEHRTCRVTSDSFGSPTCWGSTPESLSTAYREIGTGLAHECTTSLDTAVGDRLSCAGSNVYCQTGCGGGPSGGTPYVDVQDVQAGRHHTCLLQRTGDLWCWGRNQHGQTGTGSLDPVVSWPVLVRSDVVQFDLSYDNGCLLTTTDEIYCWGNNDNLQADPSGPHTPVRTPEMVSL